MNTRKSQHLRRKETDYVGNYQKLSLAPALFVIGHLELPITIIKLCAQSMDTECSVAARLLKEETTTGRTRTKIYQELNKEIKSNFCNAALSSIALA